jgi:hypothetical protein
VNLFPLLNHPVPYDRNFSPFTIDGNSFDLWEEYILERISAVTRHLRNCGSQVSGVEFSKVVIQWGR